MISAERLGRENSRFEEALARWEVHVHACSRCFQFGLDQCADGEDLSAIAMEARAAFDRVLAAANRLRRAGYGRRLFGGVPA